MNKNYEVDYVISATGKFCLESIEDGAAHNKFDEIVGTLKELGMDIHIAAIDTIIETDGEKES